MTPPALSIIIPTLNEQACLGALLDDLAKQTNIELQIIVADGGSTDATRALANKVSWAEAARGRGAQMNAGRQVANCDTLLFLHADSRLSQPNQLANALLALRDAGPRAAGHFALQFLDAPQAASGFYRHLEAKSRLNRPETINGDQGLMISADFFDALGGFDENWPFLEDQAISSKIFEQGQWILLPATLQTSARRFEQEGRAARYFLMMLIMCARRARLNSFLHQARGLYPPQADTQQTKVSPFLKLLLELAEDSADFWPCMADYCLDNAWQPLFVVDQYLGRKMLLPLYDRLQDKMPRSSLVHVLTPLLRMLFKGPVLFALESHENQG